MCRVQELAGGGPPPRPQAASAGQPGPPPPPRPLAARREPGAGFLRRLTGWKITCYPAAAACAAARAVFTVGERSLCYFRAGARAASPWGSGQDAQRPGLGWPEPAACLPLPPLLLSPHRRQGHLHGVGGAGGQGRAPSRSELRCSWLRLLPQLGGDEATPGPGPPTPSVVWAAQGLPGGGPPGLSQLESWLWPLGRCPLHCPRHMCGTRTHGAHT